ncbi:hypothetical protein C5167_045667 [Papaver somniferum]|uniref:3-oxoacyl-[acyl-carrier-protein] reductase n=1 Tax=Papaver somniferum TaxID=3469 RepID=A0A4Y7LFD8_PAPSO|nr:hypothetical protein C5167_045667 [Papaver somniferum]
MSESKSYLSKFLISLLFFNESLFGIEKSQKEQKQRKKVLELVTNSRSRYEPASLTSPDWSPWRLVLPTVALRQVTTQLHDRSSNEDSLVLKFYQTGLMKENTIAIHLASQGAKLVINYSSSNSTQADLLAEELNNTNSSSSSSSSHPKAVAIRANVSDPDQVKSLFDQTEQVFGSTIHILVNCAGILDSKYPSLAITSVEDWDSTFSVNTKGAFLCCKEAANRLTRGGGGPYAASKAAVETMVKILAKELKGTGITANCIAPGTIATELFYAGKTEETIK